MKTKPKKQGYENHTKFVMAYENAHSFLDMNQKNPEEFALLYEVN